MKAIFCGVCVTVFVTVSVWAGTAAGGDKIVISHRGASGYLPEHTLEAYAMAYGMGADYVEPDLVLTKDRRFICLHDIHLESTTDVEERFPERARADGRWYAADFTLSEIKQLNAQERTAARFPLGQSRFEVPTFEEMIELVQGLNKTTGRDVGVYPELKEPSWHAKEGLPMEEAFLETVTRYGYAGPQARIFVQCFEAPALKHLRYELRCALPMIQLISGDKDQEGMLTEKGLDDIAAYANGIGPDKKCVEADAALVQRAHARGLAVHPYTLRRDMRAPKYKSFEEELRQFYVVYDVDGVFTDFPDEAAQFLLKAGLRR